MCNDIDEDNLVFWNMEIACEERETQAYRTQTELIKFYGEISNCNPKFLLEESVEVKPDVCPPVIRKCNKWTQGNL